jgi:hypothetical protein
MARRPRGPSLTLSPMADRYRAIGFTEIVVYAPKPQGRAVLDKVVTRLDDLKS